MKVFLKFIFAFIVGLVATAGIYAENPLSILGEHGSYSVSRPLLLDFAVSLHFFEEEEEEIDISDFDDWTASYYAASFLKEFFSDDGTLDAFQKTPPREPSYGVRFVLNKEEDEIVLLGHIDRQDTWDWYGATAKPEMVAALIGYCRAKAGEPSLVPNPDRAGNYRQLDEQR